MVIYFYRIEVLIIIGFYFKGYMKRVIVVRLVKYVEVIVNRSVNEYIKVLVDRYSNLIDF